ncbi:hypothetical protein GDO81_000647 [Engystomops pustulosus]|uniref:ATP synthase F0 subunit 8 n=1 Tax=Engystomops pustulosus TaxID=76066 RepID=A0AAV7D6P7_ENGPU|nr:hypothetical protein GDO81_000647 [Engystomops pustulosus]
MESSAPYFKIAMPWDMNLLLFYVALFFILLFLLLLLVVALLCQLKDSISSKVVLQSRHSMSFREDKTP